MQHTFHIPVLGLGYSIDTPLKVARYGISSVVSIVDDELIERMREFHVLKNNQEFIPIGKKEGDYRAKRITAYLNLLNELVNNQINELKEREFIEGSDITTYFELLPDSAILKKQYGEMMLMPKNEVKQMMQQNLRRSISAGCIDVNIMAKVDKANFSVNGDYLGDENTDALSALRGFANSDLKSHIVLSAGLNPRLYSYLENFDNFYQDEHGNFSKKVILKVSDYRSALIQAKILAKKGIWVSEFRIESGLNCGGHAFATDGLLLGPILEEFKQKRSELLNELFAIYSKALEGKSMAYSDTPVQRITVQGGIGTASENDFLLNYYQLDGTGWGSPFLLVPEATNVDAETLNNLIQSKEDDFYISNSSPLGVLFNNFKSSSIEGERLERIEQGRPGSPCTKKYLCTNTEFTEQPVCTASRQYQNLKIEQLKSLGLPEHEFDKLYNSITEKICLCEGLCASVYLKNGILTKKESNAVSICPGPNLAYFSSKYTLKEMVSHIYGKLNLLSTALRPNMFINELNLYVDYLKKDVSGSLNRIDDKKLKYFVKFHQQLAHGISYYRALSNQLGNSFGDIESQLKIAEGKLHKLAESLNPVRQL